ncbi:hypothetical protein BpHYR1_023613 [Brachionus plicatilis]|uniref:Uncharacterized protein n=1 Tax=Brachionus plicatilis TaxID=10195 RepID=A0A3M7SR30_BRAPC|nr:hypothetical protein BpHYR1_023613 [Brachionus plicatilis]
MIYFLEKYGLYAFQHRFLDRMLSFSFKTLFYHNSPENFRQNTLFYHNSPENLKIVLELLTIDSKLVSTHKGFSKRLKMRQNFDLDVLYN